MPIPVVNNTLQLTSINTFLTKYLQRVAECLRERMPTRVAIFVRTKSPLYLCAPDEIVKAACSSLDIASDINKSKLLVVEKWDRLNILVFDIFHEKYDLSTAHQEENLPVILIDFGKRYSVIKAAMKNFEGKVNRGVARHHNLNGWDKTPPYVADHTGTKVPTYPNPRDLSICRWN